MANVVGLQGTTRVAVLIDRNGKVRRMRISKSSGSILLDNAAVEAASESTFKPARDKDGRPIPTVAELPITFTKRSPGNAPDARRSQVPNGAAPQAGTNAQESGQRREAQSR